VHEYVLKPGVEPEAFEQAVREARKRGCFELPGLVKHRFVRRLRGSRPAMYAAIWTYDGPEAWAALWGDVEHPKPRDQFPDCWKVWENEILEPLIDRDPQFIEYAAYEEYGDD
jgi:hypothetical protein